LTAWRSGPLPASFADQKDDENDEEDQKNNRQQNAGNDSDLLRQCIVDGRENDLFDLQHESDAALVDDVFPVQVELRRDAGDDGVVVAQRRAVLDGVVDVGGVVVPHRHYLGLRGEVNLGLRGLRPAQLGGGETSGGRTTYLELFCLFIDMQ
jgi:hypothetical protein